MTNKQTTTHTLNHYVKSPEARFFIRLVAAVGYVVIGLIWWVLFLILDFTYQLLQELVEALTIILESISEIKYRFEELHKSMSYSEMLLRVIGTVTALTLGVLAFYVFPLIFCYSKLQITLPASVMCSLFLNQMTSHSFCVYSLL